MLKFEFDTYWSWCVCYFTLFPLPPPQKKEREGFPVFSTIFPANDFEVIVYVFYSNPTSFLFFYFFISDSIHKLKFPIIFRQHVYTCYHDKFWNSSRYCWSHRNIAIWHHRSNWKRSKIFIFPLFVLPLTSGRGGEGLYILNYIKDECYCHVALRFCHFHFDNSCIFHNLERIYFHFFWIMLFTIGLRYCMESKAPRRNSPDCCNQEGLWCV